LQELRNEYITVKIPLELAEKLDRVARDLGYRSRAEIVNDAIRRFLVMKDVEELRAINESPHESNPPRKIQVAPLTGGTKT
jgi:metal-responsive CopG/Arc/MetJ family transcriptional regulator